MNNALYLYLASFAWAIPALAFYCLGFWARRHWNAPQGWLPETVFAFACLAWPAFVAVGLLLAAAFAGLLLLVISSSVELKPRR